MAVPNPPPAGLSHRQAVFLLPAVPRRRGRRPRRPAVFHCLGQFPFQYVQHVLRRHDLAAPADGGAPAAVEKLSDLCKIRPGQRLLFPGAPRDQQVPVHHRPVDHHDPDLQLRPHLSEVVVVDPEPRLIPSLSDLSTLPSCAPHRPQDSEWLPGRRVDDAPRAVQGLVRIGAAGKPPRVGTRRLLEYEELAAVAGLLPVRARPSRRTPFMPSPRTWKVPRRGG